jgi:nucleoside-diphosphate-sugar epimerase
MAFLSRPTPWKRPTLLIAGCGDVGVRVVRLLGARWRVLALTREPARVPELRALGVRPVVGDLDRPETLGRLGALPDAVLYLVPPPPEGRADPRTARLVRALMRGGRARRVVYASTTGVYGDRRGARLDETSPMRPRTERAWRRADAEARWRAYGRASGARVSILRVPGIYALDRAGGDPRERVARGTPVLSHADDVYTNHIHADDLARACVAALHRGRAQRIVHASDDGECRMGDWYDAVADHAGLPRPPRVSRAEAERVLGAASMSFLSESRRLSNARLVRELRVRLRYPRVEDALAVMARREPALPAR